MELSWEKEGRIVAITETVFAVLIGILALIFGICFFVTEIDIYISTNWESHGIMIFTIVYIVYFLTALGLLVLLWKGVLNKSYVQCTLWYVTHSVLTAVNIFWTFHGFYYAELPLIIYAIITIILCYRIWAIHVIKFLGDQILINRGNFGENNVIEKV